MVQLGIIKEDKIMSDNINNTNPPSEPLTRVEQYLSAIAGVTSSSDIPDEPLTRIEKYLNKIVENGGGGGGGFTPTDAQLDAMNSGITSEDVEQISTNKNNISLINNYVSVVKNFRLVDLTWSQGGSGQWASSTVSVSGISKIVALTYNKDYYIRGTDRITPRISDDQTQVGFVANVGTFANIDTSINLFILGIASS